MAGKKKDKKEKQNFKNWHKELKEETKHSILGILILVLALFFTFAGLGKAGIAGSSLYKFFNFLFGAGFFLVPTVFFLVGASLLSSIKPHFMLSAVIGIILFLFSSLGAADLILGEKTGGYAGYFISLLFLKIFDFWISLILLAALFIISILIILNTPISIKIKKKEKEIQSSQPQPKQIPETKTLLVAPAAESTEEKIKEKVNIDAIIPIKKIKSRSKFNLPPLDILEQDKGKPPTGDIKANSNIIKRTLQNFGIDVEMGEISIGPSITQYTLKPAEGVKLSRIISLQNDLSLALASHPIRIEAPIPGKSLVGIEIPNSAKTIIGLGSLLSKETFQKSNLPLLISLGKDVNGNALFANLAKMPHLLIAGATGTGKSLCIHSIITSLLYRNSPQSLQFIMIDPKRVELTVYNKIPNLLTPVITEAKKAILSLKWACKEMERRYELLLKSGVRDIDSYHEKNSNYNSMPFLIVIIDEVADLMSTYPREMEASIVRLAQMSRAVGIHLIVSTQRPSVEVITGLIKANITSRIALQVASQVDSRTILDMAGAEKLLGNGDMLYLSGDAAKPKRIQGSFVSDKEIKKMVDYLVKEYKDADLEKLEEPVENIFDDKKSQESFDLDFDKDVDDNLYEEARHLVIKIGKASSSYLQRKLKIGYARAARILDMLEERGVVGPADGAKPREILIKEEEEREKKNLEIQ